MEELHGRDLMEACNASGRSRNEPIGDLTDEQKESPTPMIRITSLALPLDHTEEELRLAIAVRLGIKEAEVTRFTVFKRSHDARRRNAIKLVYMIDAETPLEEQVLTRLDDDAQIHSTPDTTYRFTTRAPGGVEPRPVVIGMGPCGLFAGLSLAQMGLRPILLERGKAVRERTIDTFDFWRRGKLDPESNVQFGEGGAGTFSDGKLYSQVKDPGHCGRKVLGDLVEAGAPEEILTEARPHIGTFRLVKVVENMRAKILSLGGEVRFETRVVGLDIEDGRIRGLALSDGTELRCQHVVLAVGHSARDTFSMLAESGVHITAKPFSIGVRIEHPQELIDRRRFGRSAGHPALGAADYSLVHHASNKRSVYSFCMCPGGTVVAAASEAGYVVTNGMSQWTRSERNANSGIVVGITPEDYPAGPLGGIELQRHWERKAFLAGGSSYDAPAQRVDDFLEGRPSTELGTVTPSYTPGIRLGDLTTCLPEYVVEAIREALPVFDRKIRGFAMPDALMTGVETRTSSPIRIERGADFQSLNTAGLFPAGEGAGYAGGILSSGIDGIKVAEALALDMVGAAGE